VNSSLAVSIPCFRRPHLLRCLLQSLASDQSARLTEVYLFDDSPEKCNYILSEDFAGSFKKVYYNHNPQNLGIDLNISQALFAPCADYIWLMGEDDLIQSGALTHIYKYLQHKLNPDLVFVNYTHYTPAFSKSIHTDLQKAETSKQSYIDNLIIFFGFIGSVLVRKESLPCTNSYVSLGSYFSHIGVILEVIDKSDCQGLGIIKQPLVMNRVGDLSAFSWSDDALNVYQGFSLILNYMQDHSILSSVTLGSAIKQAHLSFNPFAKPSRIIRLRSEGVISLHDYLSTDISIYQKIIMLPFVLLSEKVAKSIVDIYSSLSLSRFKK